VFALGEEASDLFGKFDFVFEGERKEKQIVANHKFLFETAEDAILVKDVLNNKVGDYDYGFEVSFFLLSKDVKTSARKFKNPEEEVKIFLNLIGVTSFSEDEEEDSE